MPKSGHDPCPDHKPAGKKFMTHRECQVSTCLFAVLISAVLLFSACGQSTDAFLARGEEYLQKRKFHDALMQFRSAKESDPAEAKAHWGLARSYEQLGQFNEALQELRQTVDIDETHLDAKAKLGNYLLLMTPPMVPEAEAIRDEILRSDPDFIEGHMLTASILAAKGVPDAEVVAAVNGVIALDPQRIETHISLQRFYMTRDNAGEAEKAILAGLSASPRSVLGHVEYARFLMYSGRDTEAENKFNEAIAIDNLDIEAREAIADFYLTAGQYEKAEQAHLKLAEIQGNSPESRLDLAGFYQKIARSPEAIKVLEEILSDTPEYARARYKLGQIFLDMRDHTKVAEQLEALLAVDDTDVEALMLRSRLHTQQHAPDKAINDLQEVLKKQPSGREPLYLMAHAQLSAGQVDHANAFIADLERYHPNDLRVGILQIHSAFAIGEPENVVRLANGLLDKITLEVPNAVNSFQTIQDLRLRAISSRGLANLDLMNLKAARADLESLVNASPNSATALVNLAKVAVAERNYVQAGDLFAKASNFDPKNFDAISGVVDVSLRVGRVDAAREKIDEFISSGIDDPTLLAGLRYLRSRTFEADKNDAAAEAELLAAMSADPRYLPAYSGYAALLIKDNRTDEAITQYQTVIQLRPSAQIYTLLGMLEESRSRFNDAEAAYRKALEFSSGQPIAANNLAWLLAEREGNLDEALQLASAAVNLDPDVAGYHDTLGYVYFQKGLYLPAIEKFRRAVALEEAHSKKTGIASNPGYRQRLGMALARSSGRTASNNVDKTLLRSTGKRGEGELRSMRGLRAGS